MNQTMHSDDPAFYIILDDEDLLAQLLFLYEISGGKMSRWIDEDFRTLRMAIDIASYDANELAANIQTIEQTCAELFPQADCHLIVSAVQFAELNNKIVFGELYSFFDFADRDGNFDDTRIRQCENGTDRAYSKYLSRHRYRGDYGVSENFAGYDDNGNYADDSRYCRRRHYSFYQSHRVSF